MSNSTKDYYIKQACPVGSDLYYSLLKAKPKQREATILIFSFYQSIFHCLFKLHEANITLTKLSWWQLQIEKLFESDADHPVLKALKPHIKTFNLDKALFLEIIDGFITYFQHPIFQTQEDLNQHLARTAGSRDLLINKIFNHNDIETTINTAVSIEKIYLLQKANPLIAHGHCFIPQDILQHHQLTFDDVATLKANEKTNILFRTMAQHSQFEIEKSLTHTLSVRAKIAKKLLTKIKKHKFQVLEKNIQLSPIRKLWMSWQTI